MFDEFPMIFWGFLLFYYDWGYIPDEFLMSFFCGSDEFSVVSDEFLINLLGALMNF